MVTLNAWQLFAPVLVAQAFLVAQAVCAPAQAFAADSWLDRPLTSWNREGSSLPRMPRAPADAGESPTASRCREQVRQPAGEGEKAAARNGWFVCSPVETNGTTTVFRAMSGVDGMCRPLGYQAFIYSAGKYAGTLSPTPMNSRTDGALTEIRLVNPTTLASEFARYSASDPLCCPSGISTVQYRLRNDEIPWLVATGVTTAPTSNAKAEPANLASLFGRRWVLTEMDGQLINADKPWLEFEEKSRRASGDSGCNRFSGGFQASGTSLRFSPMASTRRACLAEEANRLEMNFLQGLEKVTRFEVRQNVLRLYIGDKPSLEFAAK
jgi:heat shock protein HslJ